jgi:hypothetical protein
MGAYARNNRGSNGGRSCAKVQSTQRRLVPVAHTVVPVAHTVVPVAHTVVALVAATANGRAIDDDNGRAIDDDNGRAIDDDNGSAGTATDRYSTLSFTSNLHTTTL